MRRRCGGAVAQAGHLDLGLWPDQPADRAADRGRPEPAGRCPRQGGADRARRRAQADSAGLRPLLLFSGKRRAVCVALAIRRDHRGRVRRPPRRLEAVLGRRLVPQLAARRRLLRPGQPVAAGSHPAAQPVLRERANRRDRSSRRTRRDRARCAREPPRRRGDGVLPVRAHRTARQPSVVDAPLDPCGPGAAAPRRTGHPATLEGRGRCGRRDLAGRLFVSAEAAGQASVRAEPPSVCRVDARLSSLCLDRLRGARCRRRLRGLPSLRRADKTLNAPARLHAKPPIAPNLKGTG